MPSCTRRNSSNCLPFSLSLHVLVETHRIVFLLFLDLHRGGIGRGFVLVVSGIRDLFLGTISLLAPVELASTIARRALATASAAVAIVFAAAALFATLATAVAALSTLAAL